MRLRQSLTPFDPSPAVRGVRDAVVGWALLTAAVLLQVTVVVDARVVGGTPSLLVVCVVAVALLRGPVPGALAGFYGGFLADALGAGLVGATSLVLVLVGYACGAWGESVSDRAALRPLLLVAVMSVLADLGSLTVAVLVGTGPAIGTTLIAGAVPAAMVNLLLAIVVYPLVRRLLGRPGQATAGVSRAVTA
jgi:rod shape-determining protein MreD